MGPGGAGYESVGSLNRATTPRPVRLVPPGAVGRLSIRGHEAQTIEQRAGSLALARPKPRLELGQVHARRAENVPTSDEAQHHRLDRLPPPEPLDQDGAIE